MKTKDIEIPTANEIMNRRVEALTPDMPIGEAVDVLLRRGYSGAPVIDAERKPIGALSEHDCVRVLAEALYEGWPTGTVADHMTHGVETVDLDANLFTVAQTFTAHRARRLPVVHEGRLVGLITRRDLLRALDRFRDHVGPAKPTHDV